MYSTIEKIKRSRRRGAGEEEEVLHYSLFYYLILHLF